MPTTELRVAFRPMSPNQLNDRNSADIPIPVELLASPLHPPGQHHHRPADPTIFFNNQSQTVRAPIGLPADFAAVRAALDIPLHAGIARPAGGSGRGPLMSAASPTAATSRVADSDWREALDVGLGQ
ncbi:hypothetical protein ACQPZF_11425 [Actinosynnema sp. CS-041913]|uniref:hypothetical protein n=1 Tax=Actinosynnema sp. CS-041913 TaxID=3239917 RepID=UPI003D90BE06